MKVFSTFLIAIISLSSNIFSQGVWPTHIITTDAADARSVYSIDLDEDGDNDVLSASAGDDKIAWYENLGDGIFGDQIIINDSSDIANSVYAVDIDGDGDIDVVASGGVSGRNGITWYENKGNEIFEPHKLYETPEGNFIPASVYVADLNKDGNMDVLYCAWRWTVWLNNNGTFFTDTQIFNNDNSQDASSIYAEDIDGDGNIDVLSTYGTDNSVRWFENDGNANFTDHIISRMAIDASSVYAKDVNSDGFMDVLSASSDNDRITWYQNNGSQGFSPHHIATDADGASSVFAIDIDNDDDIDVLSASSEDDKIALYRNDGNENFTTEIITTEADVANSVFAIDVDNDGDIDVLSASRFDNKIAWYANPLIVNDVESISNEIPVEYNLSQNYPNPFNPSTTIRFSVPEESNVSVVVLNMLGEEVKIVVNQNITAGSYEVDFDATGLPSGVYFYKIQVYPVTGGAGSFIETKKMVLLK